jgi:hypothetical protein
MISSGDIGGGLPPEALASECFSFGVVVVLYYQVAFALQANHLGMMSLSFLTVVMPRDLHQDYLLPLSDQFALSSHDLLCQADQKCPFQLQRAACRILLQTDVSRHR